MIVNRCPTGSLCTKSAESILLDIYGVVPMIKAFDEIADLDPNSLAGFLQIEDLLTKRMIRNTTKTRQTAVNSLLKALRSIDIDRLNDQDYSELESKVGKVIAVYGVGVGDAITPILKEGAVKTAKRVREVMKDSYFSNPDDAPVFKVKDRRAINKVLDSNKIFINGEYSGRLSMMTSKLIAKDFETTGGSASSLANRMRTELPAYFGAHDQNYLEIVSGVQLNNARTYSQLRVYQDADLKKFEVVAVGDRKTSPFCLRIDGMTFRVDEALGVFRKMGNAKTMKGLRKAKSFVRTVGKGDNVKFKLGTGSKSYDPNDITEELLSQFGSVFPPYHPRCRTTTVGSFDND